MRIEANFVDETTKVHIFVNSKKVFGLKILKSKYFKHRPQKVGFIVFNLGQSSRGLRASACDDPIEGRSTVHIDPLLNIRDLTIIANYCILTDRCECDEVYKSV